ERFEGGKAEDYDLELGSNTFIQGFEEQVAGHKAGDKFDVKSFTNLKTESHGWEPSAKDIAELSDSQVMFINGAGMEEWEDSLEDSSDIELVNTTENVELIKGSHDHEHEDEDHDHEHEEENEEMNEDHDHENEEEASEENEQADDHEHEDQEEEHHHHHGEFDPHTWLSPKNGIAQAKVIADKLSEIDPANKDYYMDNYKEIEDELNAMIDEYTDKFASVDNKKFIVPHQAFGYLAREFDLEQIPLNSLTSTGEADAKVLKEVSDLAKAEKIKTVFYEMGGSDKEAKTLADEIGAEPKPINTLEFATDEELSSNKTYQEMIKENLEAIYESLS
ncbi:MAG: zinc ABC transporter substrate-binding protein, partial [Varibaculum cambriense]|nr:zinc ABC transporter substrate-binding protein [Varibaculum cambriense]